MLRDVWRYSILFKREKISRVPNSYNFTLHNSLYQRNEEANCIQGTAKGLIDIITLALPWSRRRPTVVMIWQRHSKSSDMSCTATFFFFSRSCLMQRCRIPSCSISNLPSSPVGRGGAKKGFRETFQKGTKLDGKFLDGTRLTHQQTWCCQASCAWPWNTALAPPCWAVHPSCRALQDGYNVP